MIISTYTEYDEKGNIKSQTTTQTYNDDTFSDGEVCKSYNTCCDECSKDMIEKISITTDELFAIAMRSVGLIETIRDPRVIQFMEALDDLQELLKEDME